MSDTCGIVVIARQGNPSPEPTEKEVRKKVRKIIATVAATIVAGGGLTVALVLLMRLLVVGQVDVLMLAVPVALFAGLVGTAVLVQLLIDRRNGALQPPVQ